MVNWWHSSASPAAQFKFLFCITLQFSKMGNNFFWSNMEKMSHKIHQSDSKILAPIGIELGPELFCIRIICLEQSISRTLDRQDGLKFSLSPISLLLKHFFAKQCKKLKGVSWQLFCKDNVATVLQHHFIRLQNVAKWLPINWWFL